MYKIIANWKMYLSVRDSRELAAKVAGLWEQSKCPEVELIICPSVSALVDVVHQIGDQQIKVGAQDVASSKTLGAFTGQIAADQLVELGCSHVIIGHSEMRQFMAETDERVRAKLFNAIEHNLHPIVCIGETAEDKDAGQTEQVIEKQLHTIFSGAELKASQFTIAYEPRWAISAVSGGATVDPNYAEMVHKLIMHTMQEFSSISNQEELQVLYGGSVDANNIMDFLNIDTVSGALIGSASAKSDRLEELINKLQSSIC